jgi:outer membrane biosynthesis protein TonB
MNEKPTSLSISWYILVSILLHFVFLQLEKVKSDLDKNSKEKEASVTVEKWVDEKDRKEVVRTSKALEQKESKTPSRYGGEFQNRVEKETRSPLVGKFQEGFIAKGGGEDNSENKESLDGEEEAAPPTSKGALSMNQLMLGRTPNVLPKDIEEGSNTLLNTDKVLYASFINRIAEQIYDPWVRQINNAITNYRITNKKVETNLYITKISVVLDSKGEITSIQLIKGSGLTDIDEAPKKAFWEVASFPNPPTQLIQADGFVRLSYEFQLEFKQSNFNIIPGQI